MKYLYQQLLAFWFLIILTIIFIGVAFTNINRRTLVNQNYQQIEEYLGTVNIMLDQSESVFSDSFSDANNGLSREEHLQNTLAQAESILTTQGLTFALISSNKTVLYPAKEIEISKELLNDSEWKNIRNGVPIYKTINRNLAGEPKQTSYVLSSRYVANNFDGILIAAKSAHDLEYSQKLITDNLLKGFIISLLFGGAISFGLAARQVKKINDLKRAVNQIANGNYEIAIEEKDNKDEFNELAHDFNKMAVALQDNEKEIIRQEELRKQFMANTSHEMRTPLTTIKGLLEGLRYNAIPEAQKDKAVILMQNETDRLIRLVKQNLDYENIRSHQITLSLTHFDAVEAIKNIFTQLNEKATTMNNELHLVNDHPIEIYADHDRFIQIMVNVIQNAIQFTQNGKVKVAVQDTASDTVVTVEDNGIGMSEEEQKNIWDRYYKADPSRKNTKLSESGLGLSIVKELIRLHEGTIEVSSKINEGTLFTIRFPKRG